MPQINKSTLSIELKVRKVIVSNFHLEETVLNSFKIIHPTSTHTYFKEDEKQEEFFIFPYTFPPFFENHSQAYLEEFLALYKFISKDIDNHYHDDILFLSYIYVSEKDRKHSNLDKETWYRTSGKLLLDFIKVPIPILTEINILDAFHEEPSLDPEEIQEYILAYLGIASGKKESYFLINPQKPNSKINFKKVDEDLWKKITRLIQRDRNVSISIGDGKYLTISKNIALKFHPAVKSKTLKSFGIEEQYQNTHFLQLILTQLFNDQKNQKTNFYYALLEHDFIIDKNYRPLTSAIGNYNRTSQHYYVLEILHEALLKYLKDHKLLFDTSSIKAKQKRNDFIYQYLLILDLILAPKLTTANTDINNIESIQSSLQDYIANKKGKIYYATKRLADMFHNNDRQKKLKKQKKVKD